VRESARKGGSPSSVDLGHHRQTLADVATRQFRFVSFSFPPPIILFRLPFSGNHGGLSHPDAKASTAFIVFTFSFACPPRRVSER
jgi:hypothetical protein